jgi:hypothetical protein
LIGSDASTAAWGRQNCLPSVLRRRTKNSRSGKTCRTLAQSALQYRLGTHMCSMRLVAKSDTSGFAPALSCCQSSPFNLVLIFKASSAAVPTAWRREFRRGQRDPDHQFWRDPYQKVVGWLFASRWKAAIWLHSPQFFLIGPRDLSSGGGAGLESEIRRKGSRSPLWSARWLMDGPPMSCARE